MEQIAARMRSYAHTHGMYGLTSADADEVLEALAAGWKPTNFIEECMVRDVGRRTGAFHVPGYGVPDRPSKPYGKKKHQWPKGAQA